MINDNTNIKTKPYKCKDCNLEFAIVDEVIRHLEASHLGGKKVIETPVELPKKEEILEI